MKKISDLPKLMKCIKHAEELSQKVKLDGVGKSEQSVYLQRVSKVFNQYGPILLKKKVFQTQLDPTGKVISMHQYSSMVGIVQQVSRDNNTYTIKFKSLFKGSFDLEYLYVTTKDLPDLAFHKLTDTEYQVVKDLLDKEVPKIQLYPIQVDKSLEENQERMKALGFNEISNSNYQFAKLYPQKCYITRFGRVLFESDFNLSDGVYQIIK